MLVGGKSAQPRGFTLIEMMLVVMIIGMISAIAYPQYQVLSRANLRATSRKLAGTIRYLYARSVMDKKYWRLAFDMDEKKVWAERLELTEDGTGKEFVKTDTANLRRLKIPSGVLIRSIQVAGRDMKENGIEYINFNPFGGVERAAIYLMHGNGKWVFTLATKPMSGRVAIFEHDVEIDLDQTALGEDD